jgi:hypothetical protein
MKLIAVRTEMLVAVSTEAPLSQLIVELLSWVARLEGIHSPAFWTLHGRAHVSSGGTHLGGGTVNQAHSYAYWSSLSAVCEHGIRGWTGQQGRRDFVANKRPT